MKTSDIFVKNLVNKKILLAAFYHLTYQYYHYSSYITLQAAVDKVSRHIHGLAKHDILLLLY